MSDDVREADARLTDLVEDLVDVVRAGDDLGDVLSAALMMVAERLGSVEALVAGRPGSWESADIRHLAGGANVPDSALNRVIPIR